jgi:dipeptidase E
MNLFLASNIGGVKKENGNMIPVKFYEKNEFLKNLKKYIKNYRKFVLIASDPDNYKRNDMFLQMDIEALQLSGLTFKEYLVLDGRGKENITSILKDCDLIFLSGGNTLTQNIFFNNVNLKENLKDIDSVIVGISAGSINAANNVYNSPEIEEDLKHTPYLKGLDLTNINIEPHFILEDLSNDYNKKLQRKEILKESYNRTLIALTDGAYILQTDKDCKLYGESYKIKEGIITKICNNDECVILVDNGVSIDIICKIKFRK